MGSGANRRLGLSGAAMMEGGNETSEGVGEGGMTRDWPLEVGLCVRFCCANLALACAVRAVRAVCRRGRQK